MFLCFVDIASNTDSCEPVCIMQHSLGSVLLMETSDGGVMDIILQQLEDMSLHFENMLSRL
jgi:hypothetical protein